MIRRALILTIIIGLGYMSYNMAANIGTAITKASDSYVRNRVVELRGELATCSGVQIKAPSNKVYILTARHCGALLDEDHSMIATTENGIKTRVYLVKTSMANDLLLLTAASNDSVDLAPGFYKHESIHTITHGFGFACHRTDGEIVQAAEMDIEDLTLNLIVTTAIVRPGSSGGPVLNDRGELVGIVSAGDMELYSYIVPINYIKAFIKNK